MLFNNVYTDAMRKIFVLWLLLLPVVSLAQPYTVKQLGIEKGLSNNYVVSIAQDKQGFLWFATEEGLNKFLLLHLCCMCMEIMMTNMSRYRRRAVPALRIRYSYMKESGSSDLAVRCVTAPGQTSIRSGR